MGMEILGADAQRVRTAIQAGDVEALQAMKKEEIRAAWEREISVVGMPVPGEGFSVNFDVADAMIWESGLAMTEEDPIQVRGIDNLMHPLAWEKALTIPMLQKQHYAAVIQKKWRLQAEADAATTVAELAAISWS